MTVSKSKINLWLVLLILVLTSNLLLYQTQLGELVLPENTNPVVLGSLFDFLITAPILFMLYKKKFSWKLTITLIASGCIAARLIIPSKLLQPFNTITWVGIGIEAIIVIFELSLIISLIRYLPKIIVSVRRSTLPAVFSFSNAVDKYVAKNPLIYVICAESLMFYYAFCSWKKKPQEGITIYKNSSLIAFQIMLIHAVVIETIGLHWIFHLVGISPIVSIILLILNIYGVIFLLGDIQALRLNPIYINNESIYITQGLMKRAEIPFHNIEDIVIDKSVLQKKLSKDTLDFVARDFEKVYPDVILKLKTPIKATLVMGIQKEYSQVAIRTDAPNEFFEILQNRIKK